jgi:hypothetical protein
MMQE